MRNNEEFTQEQETTKEDVLDLISKEYPIKLHDSGERGIDVISETHLFNNEEKAQLLAVTDSMEKAFYNSQVFRTQTELEVSVLNDVKFPTPASKYYQCLRELNVHQSELVHLLYDYQTKQQDIKLLGAEIKDCRIKISEASSKDQPELEWCQDKVNLAKKEIELRRELFSLRTLKKTADGRKQEILQLDQKMKELEPILIQQNIPIDDPNAHQLISYSVRFIRQIMNAGASTPGLADINNLVGNLISTLKRVNQKSLMGGVLQYLELPEKKFLLEKGLILHEGLRNIVEVEIAEFNKRVELAQKAHQQKLKILDGDKNGKSISVK